MTDFTNAQLADSPLLCWPLDANANDVSGNARHGTVTGTWNFGVSQSVSTYLGNGSSAGTAGTSTITTPSIAWPSGVISIEMWADVVIDATMFWGFSSWDSWGSSGAININNGSSTIPFAAGHPLTGLHHLVWVFQQGVALGTLGKLYVDGTLYASAGGITAPTLGTQTLHLSGWNNDTGYRWSLNRFVMGFAVYNTELTQAQVTAHYLASFAPMYSDAFAGTRTTITVPVTKTYTTTSYTTEASEPLGNGPSANTAWGTFIPATTGVYQIDTIGSSYDTALAVYTGTSIGALTLVKADDSSGGSSNAKVTLAMTAGTTYQIQAGGANGATGGTLVITITSVAATLADDFLAGGFITVGSSSTIKTNPNPNTLVTQPAAETILPGCDIQVVAGATVPISWDLQASMNAGGQTKQVTWRLRRDNLSGTILASIVKSATVDSSAGNDSGFAWASSYTDVAPTTGRYVLTSQATAFASSVYVAKSVYSVTGAPPSTAGFTTESGEPLTMPVAATGWSRFRPTYTGIYQIDTIGASFDTGLAVYSGSTLGSLTLLASDNNSGGSNTSKLSVHLDAGVIYPIQVGAGSGTATGTVPITVTLLSYDGGTIPQPTVAATLVAATGWLYKGRSSHAQDALAGG